MLCYCIATNIAWVQGLDAPASVASFTMLLALAMATAMAMILRTKTSTQDPTVWDEGVEH